MVVEWRRGLKTCLKPFVRALGHKKRDRMCSSYVPVLFGRGDRQSAQPMAARDGAVVHDKLHHFVASGV
jgi:hypothetical protein